MPRNAPPTGPVSSVADRICGGVSAVLCIACFTGGNLTHSSQWQLTFIIAGLLYMMTTLGLVFENGVD